jgi:hypothetical protein
VSVVLVIGPNEITDSTRNRLRQEVAKLRSYLEAPPSELRVILGTLDQNDPPGFIFDVAV